MGTHTDSYPDVRTHTAHRGDMLGRGGEHSVHHQRVWRVTVSGHLLLGSLVWALAILSYTPPKLLDEILMIDDANLDGWKFHDRLKAIHPKIRVLRNEEHQGLIRSKVIGAATVASPVLVFLEPHCIVTKKWLQPLLEKMN